MSLQVNGSKEALRRLMTIFLKYREDKGCPLLFKGK